MTANRFRDLLPHGVRGRLGSAKRALERWTAPRRAAVLRQRTLSASTTPRGSATEALFARLDVADVAAIEARLDAGQRRVVDGASALDRKRVLLAYGVHHRVAPVIAKTGLTSAEPSSEVHATGRGALAAGGSTYYADLVLDALADAGLGLDDGARALDFGCSTGRIVRVLAALRPDVKWHGCDPIASSMSWAADHLPGVSFLTSPKEPPLAYGGASMDLVFAISIWSHYAEGAALRWLAEMERIVAPGGLLLLTTHGFHSVAWWRGARPARQLAAIEQAMLRSGHWFAADHYADGKFDTFSGEWGNAFVSPEWLLLHVGARWSVIGFQPGTVEGNQDLYLLQRR